jgi:hypothetical protein
MKRKAIAVGVILSILSILIVFGSSLAVAAGRPDGEPAVSMLASGLQGSSGSTVGPDGALYVTEGALGRISRVDPQTGDVTTYAEGLPAWVIPVGGAIDVAFMDGTAYALVTLVNDPLLGGNNPGGIYRMDSPTTFSLIADISAFSIANPPEDTDFFLVTGVQYAMETFHDGFLVTDGHHNRVLRVTLDGIVSEMMTFDNIVPTGLEVRGNTVYMAEAGPNPHLPEDGKVVTFEPGSSTATEVAAGAPLLVDVEYGPGQTLYALAQGIFPVGADDGAPALPNTGSLVKVNTDGSFSFITNNLNQPTSFEIIGNTIFVVTLTGEIWTIEGVSAPPPSFPD